MTVVVVNAKNLAVSEHSGDALDVFAVDGSLYRVEPGALRRLMAADEMPGDDTVDAPAGSVATGKLGLAPGYACNVPHVRLLLSADGALRLTTRADVRGSERASAYRIPDRTWEQARECPVRLVRGTVGEGWAFELGGEAGVAWALQGMAVQVDRVAP
jgi:hypothetical protein